MTPDPDPDPVRAHDPPADATALEGALDEGLRTRITDGWVNYYRQELETAHRARRRVAAQAAELARQLGEAKGALARADESDRVAAQLATALRQIRAYRTPGAPMTIVEIIDGALGIWEDLRARRAAREGEPEAGTP